MSERSNSYICSQLRQKCDYASLIASDCTTSNVSVRRWLKSTCQMRTYNEKLLRLKAYQNQNERWPKVVMFYIDN